MAINLSTGYQTKIDYQLGHWNKESILAQSSVLLGRCFFSLIFIISSIGHFSAPTVNYAASQGLPFAALLVPLSGGIALLGGLSILFGYQARIGALLIILFLVPVTLVMHNFWAVSDPATAQLQQIMFLKNVSMLGGAILIFNFGAGPISFDERKHP